MHPRCSARNDVRGVTLGAGCGVATCPRSVLGADEPGEEAVVGWATAESSATGCGADHDRMTSVPSRSSLVSRWRHWFRAWGSDEPATDDSAA